MNYLALLKELYRLMSRRRRRQATVVVFLLLLATFAEVMSIGAIIPLLSGLTAPDEILSSKFLAPFFSYFHIDDFQSLSIILISSFALIIILSGCLRLCLLIVSSRLAFRIGIDMSELIFQNTLHKPFEEHSLTNSSEIISAVATKSTTIISGLIRPTMNLVTYGFMLMSVFSFLIYVYPAVTVAILVVLGASYYVITLVMRAALIRNSQIIADENNRLIQILRETLDNIRAVVLGKKYEFIENRFERANTQLRLSGASNEIIASSPRFVIESIGMIFICCIILFFSIRGHSRFIESISLIGVIVFSAQRMLPLAQQVYNSWAQMKGSLDSIADAVSLAGQECVAVLDAPKAQLCFKDRVTFRGVSFCYKQAPVEVLRGVNLEIFPGDVIGVVGESGGGKSTFADLLLGLLRPTSGDILIDGQQLTDITAGSWQSLVAYSPQNVALVDASIIENVAFFEEPNRIDRHRVIECLRSAAFPLDFDLNKNIGENGEALSGGQRQRLSIARALYTPSKLYVFDEVTSALDEYNEHLVMNNLLETLTDSTLVFISHRIKTLEKCNRLFRVSDSSVSEVPTAYLQAVVDELPARSS